MNLTAIATILLGALERYAHLRIIDRDPLAVGYHLD